MDETAGSGTPDHGPTTGARLGASLEGLYRWVRRTPPPGEISLPAMALLSRLSVDGGAGVSALARLERVSQPAMTQMVDRLSREGCVARTPSPTDGRAVVVTITDAGSALLAARRAARAQDLDALLTAAPSSDADAVMAALPALSRLAAAATSTRSTPQPPTAQPLTAQPLTGDET